MLIVFGGFPLFMAIPLFLLYGLIVNWKFGAVMAIISFLKKKGFKHNIFMPGLAIILAEFFTWQIFPWYFGNLAAGNLILSQTVEYSGVYGLSILVFIVSYALYKLPLLRIHYLKRKYFKKVYGRFMLKPALILLLFIIVGFGLLKKWESVEPVSSKRVMIIQPDGPLEFRDGRSLRETMEELMNRIESLVLKEAEAGKPDLIVLPESGVPFYSTNNIPATTTFDPVYWSRYEALVFQLANRFKANVFINEVDSTFADNKPSRKSLRHFNNSVLFDPNGKRGEFYKKSYLLAFGEYIPFGEEIPVLYDIIPQIGHFLPGKEQNLITYYQNKQQPPEFKKSHLRWMDSSFMNMDSQRDYYKDYQVEVSESGKFLPLICYEVILPEFVRKFSKSGNPDFIVNITNDKWYGNTVEPYEHFELARLRSIEYRRWMVRGTNSGVSGFVDHLGRVTNNKFTKIGQSEAYSRNIDIIQSGPTFYLLFGNLLVWLYIFASAGYFGYIIYYKKR